MVSDGLYAFSNILRLLPAVTVAADVSRRAYMYGNMYERADGIRNGNVQCVSCFKQMAIPPRPLRREMCALSHHIPS